MIHPLASSHLTHKLTMAPRPSRRTRPRPSRLLGVRHVLTLWAACYGSIPLAESFLARAPTNHVATPTTPMLTSGANPMSRHGRDGLAPASLPVTGRRSDPRSRSYVAPRTALKIATESGSTDSGTAKRTRKRKTFWECLASAVSQRAAIRASSPTYNAIGASAKDRTKVQIKTLIRVVLPSLAVGAAAIFAFPALAMFLVSLVSDQGAMTVLSTDSSQFVQNFLSVSSLLFSILVGQTYVSAVVL